MKTPVPELPNKMKPLFITALLKVKTFLLAAPFILTSLVFNFSNIILGIINNNIFFVLYIFAAFISILLPATFSPAEFVKKLEEKLGLDEDTALTCCGLYMGCGHKMSGVESRVPGKPLQTGIVEDAEVSPIKKEAENDENFDMQEMLAKAEQLEPPPVECGGFIENLTSAFNVGYTNVFCINRPIGKDTPSVRHFMIGLYPLHFVVNMTTLVFERYFSDTDVIRIRGHIFDYNKVILVATLTGLANSILFILFYYPNFFSALLRLMFDSLAKIQKVITLI